MALVTETKYDSNSGKEQRVLIKDARIGWEANLAGPNRHLPVGFTQYDYLETLGARQGGEARRLLDNNADKWDTTNEDYVSLRSSSNMNRA